MEPETYTGSAGLVELLMAATPDQVLVEVFGSDHVRKMRTLWRSPAGKSVVAKQLLRMFPEHTTYVEPFAGSAALFWAKDPSPTEILNDLDPEIAAALRFVKSVTDAEIAQLQRKQWWVRDHEEMRAIRDSAPTDRVSRFHRFMVIKLISFFGQARTVSWPDNERIKRMGFPSMLGRLAEAKKRLKGVKILNQDYRKATAAHDGPGSFHFMDPPYAGFDVSVGEKGWDDPAFAAHVKALKGKALVITGDRGDRSLWDGLNVQAKQFPRGWSKRDGTRPGNSTVILIRNWEGSVKRTSTKKVDLAPRVLKALEHGRASAAALAVALEKMRPGFDCLDGEAPALELAVELDELMAGALAAVPVLKAAGVCEETRATFQEGILDLAHLMGWDAEEIQKAAADLSKDPADETVDKGNGGGDTGDGDTSHPFNLIQAVEKAAEGAEPERFVFGFVLVPGVVDKQKDTVTPEEIRRGMFSWMVKGHQEGIQHQQAANGRALMIENYQAIVGFTIPVAKTTTGKAVKVPEGSWMQGWLVVDDELWEQVQAGDMTGFSIGGHGKRVPAGAAA